MDRQPNYLDHGTDIDSVMIQLHDSVNLLAMGNSGGEPAPGFETVERPRCYGKGSTVVSLTTQLMYEDTDADYTKTRRGILDPITQRGQ